MCVSANKSMLGHLVNASGSVELAITASLSATALPRRRSISRTPIPQCDLDCIPLVGRMRPFEHALKLSIAFGGHLAAIALRRWDGAEAGAALPVDIAVPLSAAPLRRSAFTPRICRFRRRMW